MVAGGRRRAAAGQDEFLQGFKPAVQFVKDRFQEHHPVGRDDQLSGQAQFTTDIEQAVLDRRQGGLIRLRQLVYQQLPDQAVEFIDAANGLDAQVILGDAAAVTQAGGAVIPGTRVDFRKSIAHAIRIGCLPPVLARSGISIHIVSLTVAGQRRNCHEMVMHRLPVSSPG